jgi:hypothetical protein
MVIYVDAHTRTVAATHRRAYHSLSGNHVQCREEKERRTWGKILLFVGVIVVLTACPRNAGQQSGDFPADSPRQMKEHGGL